MVDVKARIGEKSGTQDIIEDVACISARCVWIWENGEWARWWRKGQVFLKVFGVAALVGTVVYRFCEGGIQVEELGPIVHIWDNDNLLLNGGVAEDWIINSNSSKVVICLIFGFDEGIGDIGN